MFLETVLPLVSIPFGVKDGVEILLLGFLFYRLMLLVQRTRAVQLVKGIGVLLLLWLLSTTLGFPTLNWVLEKVMTMFLIALPIVFQPELRRGLEQLGRGEFFLRTWGNRDTKEVVMNILIRVCRQLAQRQMGAIVVLEQRTGLDEYARTGTVLDAQLSEDLLLSVFNVLSPLHDGAAICRGERVAAAGCFLPLSENPDLHKKYGTRHGAGVGLSEVIDAVVLVVSEERGEVSLCHQGKLFADLDDEALRQYLHHLLGPPKKHDETPAGVPPETEAAT